MKIVSACLVGEKCRFDGSEKICKKVLDLVEAGEAIAFCPELLGGLSTPRQAAEQKGEKVFTVDGVDVTLEFKKGAREFLRITNELKCNQAILKSKSPSCGSGKVYDGNFTGTLIKGDGVCTKLLKENGIEVLSENDI